MLVFITTNQKKELKQSKLWTLLLENIQRLVLGVTPFVAIEGFLDFLVPLPVFTTENMQLGVVNWENFLTLPKHEFPVLFIFSHKLELEASPTLRWKWKLRYKFRRFIFIFFITPLAQPHKPKTV